MLGRCFSKVLLLPSDKAHDGALLTLPREVLMAISAIHTALSGLARLRETGSEVVAHNVANLNTDGFARALRTEFVEVQTGGVLPVVGKDSIRSNGSTRIQAALNSRLNCRMWTSVKRPSSMMLAQRSFEANLQTSKLAISLPAASWTSRSSAQHSFLASDAAVWRSAQASQTSSSHGRLLLT